MVGHASTPENDAPIGPLNCVVDHSRIGQHVVHGWILGNKTTKNLLDPLWNTRLKLQTKGDDAHGFVVEGVRLGNISSLSMTGLAEPVGVVADFTCESLRVNFGIDPQADDGTRLLNFFILGPRKFWGANPIWRYERDGSRRIETRQPDVDIGELPFEVTVGPHLVQERDFAEDQLLERSLVCLQLSTTKDVESYPDDRLVEEAISIADDLCLLVGFLSGMPVSWFGYGSTLSRGDGFVTRSLGSSSRSDAEPNRFDPIAPGKARAFLKGAFPKLRKLRASGVDLSVPLQYCTVSAGVTFWRQRFGELFLALESMRSTYLDVHKAEFLTPDTDFSKLRGAVKAAIAQTPLRSRGLFRDDEVPALVEKKILELNRPPFWEGLKPLLEELQVPWEDLYPEPVSDQPKFVGVRHRLFHSYKAIDDKVLADETMRLEGVVHRLLLRWLDWADLWEAPDSGVRYVLTGEGLPRRGFVRKLREWSPREEGVTPDNPPASQG